MQFRRSSSSQFTRRNWARRLPFWRDAIYVAKDSLDIMWRIAPLTLLPAGLVLWSYLHEIGWPDLFRDSALSVSSLLSLVLAALILALTFLAIFLAPSVMMVATIQELHRNGLIQRDVIRLYAGGVIGWTIGMLFIWQSAALWWTLFIIPCTLVTALGLVKERRRWRGTDFANKLKRFMQVLVLAGCATFTVAFTAFPLPFVMRFVLNHPEQYNPTAQYVLFAVSVIVTVIGLMPGYVYLATLTSTFVPARPAKATLAAAAFISFIMLFAILLFAPVSSFLLTSTAVYSNDKATFQVLNSDLFKLIQAAGLEVDTKQSLSIVHAYVRYNFGGVELLCATPYFPKTSGNLAEKGKELHLEGMGCVRTQSSDLRRFRAVGIVNPVATKPREPLINSLS